MLETQKVSYYLAMLVQTNLNKQHKGGEKMREIILILAFAGTFYFVISQFVENIKLTFKDDNEEE